jgi:hypothetical protein
MQEKAISLLEENLPDLILAAPEIRFDDAPFSFRCAKLYRYLMAQGYTAYKYENVIYLKREVSSLEGAEEDAEAFAQLEHKKNLAYLPAVWGENADSVLAGWEEKRGSGSENEQDDVQGKGTQNALQENEKIRIEETEEGFDLVFEQPLDPQEITFIRLENLLDSDSAQKYTDDDRLAIAAGEETGTGRVTVSWESSLSGQDEEMSFMLYGSDYILPIGLDAYIMAENEISRLSFSYDKDAGVQPGAMRVRVY